MTRVRVRDAVALTAAGLAWLAVAAVTAPVELDCQPTSTTVAGGGVAADVSAMVARDLAADGLDRLQLDDVRPAELEWLPALLIGEGWQSRPDDGCECLYPPVDLVERVEVEGGAR